MASGRPVAHNAAGCEITLGGTERVHGRSGESGEGRITPGGKACDEGHADRCGEARAGLLRAEARCGESHAVGELRDERASRDTVRGDVHGSAHSGHHTSDLRIPEVEWDRRAAVHGAGHARDFASGAADCAGSAGGERRGDGDPGEGWSDANAGGVAGDSGGQPGTQRTWEGWSCDYAVAQSSAGWRVQVQPAEWGTCGHGCDRVDSGPGERFAAREKCWGEARAV